jgi:hypothetical protein
MYKNIEVYDNNLTFFKEEITNDDAIFNDDGNDNINIPPSVYTDRDFNKPDYEEYVFSNYSDRLKVMYNNNIILPIRYKEINNNIINNACRNKDIDNIYGNGQGVYIVQKYFIRYNSPEVIEYYRFSKNLVFDNYTKASIKNHIRNNNTIMDINRGLCVRIITFVDKNVIEDHGYVNILNNNCVIIQGNLDDLTHPLTTEYQKHNNKDKKDNVNKISYEIINNHDSRPYFVNIGNRTFRLHPSKDANRPNVCTQTVFKNKEYVGGNIVELKDMEEKLGIYRTMEEAQTNGNVGKLLELEKLEIAKKTIELDYRKLANENKKLNNEVKLLQEKHKFELEMMKDKLTLSKLDITKKNIEINNTILKHKMECQNNLIKYIFKQQELYSLKLKIMSENEKMKKDSNDGVIKNLGSMISLGKMIL